MNVPTRSPHPLPYPSDDFDAGRFRAPAYWGMIHPPAPPP